MMPKISIKYEAIRIDNLAFSKSFIAAAETQMRQAARAFLRAVIPLVPVDTGMAVGSFLNIGRFLRVAVPHGPGPFRRSRPKEGPATYKDPDGNVLLKTPESGASLTVPQNPEDAFSRKDSVFSFQFETKVYHYILNEFGVHGPWRSFEAGEEAFVEYLKSNVNKLPKIDQFIRKRRK